MNTRKPGALGALAIAMAVAGTGLVSTHGDAYAGPTGRPAHARIGCHAPTEDSVIADRRCAYDHGAWYRQGLTGHVLPSWLRIRHVPAKVRRELHLGARCVMIIGPTTVIMCPNGRVETS